MARILTWTLVMTILGIASATVAYAVSGSWWWALAALLGSGVIANALASARAPARRGRRGR
jgi:hypothetical protein